MKKAVLLLLCLACFGAASTFSRADGKDAKKSPLPTDFKRLYPSEVTNLLADSHLKTRPYRPSPGDETGEYSAASPYYEIPGTKQEGRMANDLAFYFYGEQTKVSRMELVLNVNSPLNAMPALVLLAKTASKLCHAGLQQAPELAISNAIISAPVGLQKFQAANGAVWIQRKDWSNGRGYEIQVTFY